MKKVFLSLALVATLAMASCQPSVKKAEDEGAAIKAKIENCSDPDSLKIYVQQAKDYADKLVKEGDDAAAQAYLDEVTPIVQAKDPTAVSIFDVLKEKADSTLNAAKEVADSTLGAAEEKASAAVEGAKKEVKTTAKKAVQAGKDKVEEAASNAANAAQTAVEENKEKAANAVQQSADKLKNALKK